MATRTLQTAFRAGEVTAMRVLAFREDHRLGRPPEAVVTIELPGDTDPSELLGAGASLTYALGDDGATHRFAGIVESVTLIGSPMISGTAVHHARLRVVSSIALLEGNVGCEIHQDLDVKEIVSKVLEANGIPAAMQDFRLIRSYPKRTYCVQYNESALAFISRLMEAEGLYYHVEPSDDGETIVFQDDSTTAAPIDGDDELPFRQRTGMETGVDAIYAIYAIAGESCRASSSSATTTLRAQSST